VLAVKATRLSVSPKGAEAQYTSTATGFLQRMTHRTAVPTIGIVDDDESVRTSISNLIGSIGYQAAVFESAEAFLNSGRMHDMNCLILDIQMPRLNGLELQRRLAKMQCSIPIIFVSARDQECRVRAFEQGAVAVLDKPFSDGALLDAIRSALSAPIRAVGGGKMAYTKR
jgi:FixJ family two-component response regulator